MMRTDVVALDFDGVLCDSARETGASAWRAGCSIWREWDGFVPSPLLNRFVELRPVIETGYQTVLLMRMIANGLSPHDITARFVENCESIMAEEGLEKSELVRLFGRTRDQWIGASPGEWVGLHRFYPGVIEALRETMQQRPVYIVTTKQVRFVSLLLESTGIEFSCDRIFGLDRGMGKEEVLLRLLREHGDGSPRVHFVEDRLDTLVRVAGCSELTGVVLYFAEWGYASPADRQQAHDCPRITVWGLGDFLVWNNS